MNGRISARLLKNAAEEILPADEGHSSARKEFTANPYD